MTILVYHSINDKVHDEFTVSPDLFKMQMIWLKKASYRVVSIEQALSQASTKRLICLTFDDGYEDNYTDASPVLRELGFSATIYLVPDYIGSSNIWDQPKMPVKKLLNKTQILEMEHYGIRFGSHTQRHADLRTMSINQIENDMRESKKKLESFLTRKVESFSYPWGAWRPEYLPLVEKAGYKCAVASATYGRNKLPRDRYKLHRVEIYQSDGVFNFKAKVKGFYFWKYYQSLVMSEWNWIRSKIR